MKVLELQNKLNLNQIETHILKKRPISTKKAMKKWKESSTTRNKRGSNLKMPLNKTIEENKSSNITIKKKKSNTTIEKKKSNTTINKIRDIFLMIKWSTTLKNLMVNTNSRNE
jgi:hypothetical protein